MSVTIGGTFSGLNVSSIISAIIAADSIPITKLQTTDTTLQTNSTTLGALGTSLGQLSSVLQSLTPNVLASQNATGSNPALGNATVDSTAQAGSVSLNITQLASSTMLRSGSGSNTKLTVPPAGNTAIGTVLNESAVNGQTFTINGKTITLASTDVLDDGNSTSTASVIGKINNSGAGVTATYNATTGSVSLSAASGNVLLGSATDTSDFLQQAQLFNNASNSVTSAIGIGRIDPNADLATSSLATTPTAGTFSINGVSINYNAGESLNSVISNINLSGAGVTAIYDSYEDQVVLTSKTRGPQNITVADGSSNAASALRLTTADSTLQAGNATLFTVNGSPTVRQSNSNIISASDLGVTGLTFTATGTGTSQITVAPDVTNIAAAINAFITQYNSTQQLINTDTAVSLATTSTSTSQNGPLATDTNLTFLASDLRKITSGSTSNSATIRMLSDLGIATNANDNTITQVDTSKLQDALTNHLSEVEALFNDPTVGLTNTVQSVIASYNSPLNGVIVNEQTAISQQVAFNQAQITRMQEQMAVEQTTLENEFAALDSAQASSQGLSGILSSSNGTTTTSSSTSSSSSSTLGAGSVGTSS